MKYRDMGKKIDWKASALGFGCMRLPRKKFLWFFKKVDEEEAIKIIRYAIDNGVNYIDTAHPYHGGKSELIVGKALKDGYRDKVKLVTKLPMWKVKKREDYDKFLNEQLEKLQTDHLDIYLFHSMNKKHFQTLKDLELIEKMEEAKKEGKIKYYGFSFHDSLEVFKEIIDYHDWAVCQIQYNYMDAATDFQAGTEGLKYAASKGIGIVIMEPVRGGKLADPPKQVKSIMEKSPIKRKPVDWALQFVWNKPEVGCVLSGMGSLKMVKENIESANNSGINSLSPEENVILNQIGNIYKEFIVIPCTKCEYCFESCNNGVNIPEIFDIINEYAREKDLKKAKRRYKKLVTKKEKVDNENPNGAPNLCIKCGSCVSNCPQGIDIPAMLEKVQKVVEEEQDFSQVFSK
ncbi:MAG: 4Fe-4S dicluster domain-containing protein [Candidatus Lokiarchaeota archaeon]|nr:4Fe-4S dicluster domain-containing protein [Candidatus Lokiarchaeota archaeon]